VITNAPHKHPNEEEGGWSVTYPETAPHVKYMAEEHNARLVSQKLFDKEHRFATEFAKECSREEWLQ